MKTSSSGLRSQSRVLILSLRNIISHVSRCTGYEFEDAILNFDAVDLLTPTFNFSWFEITRRLSKNMGNLVGNGKLFNPLLNKTLIEKEYDLFFFFCQYPYDLLCLNSIKGWREKCKKAVIWLDELWAKDVHKWKVMLRLLDDFDCIFMNFSSSIKSVSEIVQRPCHSLPFGVDAVRFCPYPLQADRSIDVYSMGRRSAVTHEALLKLGQEGNFFYIYDTIKNLYMLNYKEHRDLTANLLKRSRYFLANKAKFNAEQETNGQEELGSRFFDAAAGGAVMLGEPPNCEAYHQCFNWSDAVIQVPYEAANIAEIIAELNAQPERLARIQTNNIVNSLLRHDWVYRWRNILDAVELEYTPQMMYREAQLKSLAEMAVSNVTKARDNNTLLSLTSARLAS
jgi:hypothetical protein